MPKVPSRHRPLSFFCARNNIVVFFFIITHDLPDTIQTISQNRKIVVRFRVNLCLAILSNCGLVILLFLVCFLCQVTSVIYTDIQLLASYQQDSKKKIMMVVGACIFLIAAGIASVLRYRIKTHNPNNSKK